MITPQTVSAALLGLAVVLGGVLFFVYQRWYLLRRGRQTAERLRREEDASLPPSPSDYRFAISFDAAGVTVRDLRRRVRPPASQSMPWAEVHRATAFKRDLWAVDCICLFLTRADNIGLELDEEMAGWRRMVAALPAHLPGCREDWFSVVAFPAFAPNPTEIYCRTEVQAV